MKNKNKIIWKLYKISWKTRNLKTNLQNPKKKEFLERLCKEKDDSSRWWQVPKQVLPALKLRVSDPQWE